MRGAGVLEMLPIPVPGKCGVFYLLSCSPPSTEQGVVDDALHVVLLDLNLESEYHLGRKGRVVNVQSELTGLHPELEDWCFNETSSGNDGDRDRILAVPAGSKSNVTMLRAIRQGTGYWLYAIFSKRVVQFRVDGTGIHHVPVTDQGFVPTYFDQSPGSSKAYVRDASVAMTTGGEIRLAMTDFSQCAHPIPEGVPPVYSVLVMRFSTSGALLGVQGLDNGADGYPEFTTSEFVPNSPGPGQAGAAGCAWVDNATKLIVTGRRVEQPNWVPAIALYDMVSGTWQDLLPTLDIQGAPLEYVRARLHRNTAPSGTGDAIYIPHPGGLAAITGVDNGTYAFEESVATSSAATPPQLGITSTLFRPRFINGQVTGDNSAEQFVAEAASACCAFASDAFSSDITSITGANPTWTATSNPFGNAAEVTFMNDLVIEAGATINVTGMTWRFGPDAKLIIRATGYAKFTSSTLTGLVCEGYRWPGVRVEGDKNALQTTAYQGKLHLGGSTISNAVIGVRCAKELPGTVDAYGYGGPVDANGYGGILTTSTSTFRNCLTGADLGDYHKSATSLNVDDNYSYFNYTRFSTEFPMPDQLTPRNHLYIHRTRKVKVTTCSFTNDAPGFFTPDNWGTGIKVDAAEITVQGSPNPNYSNVRNLSTGIDRMNCIKLPITVDGMLFSGNIKGIWDHACYFGRYTNNTFAVPDQGTAPTHRYGIELDQSRYFTIERNTFTGGVNRDRSTGIFFKGINALNDEYSYDDERIYDNDFLELRYGCLVNDVHRSYDGSQEDNGLQIFCGYYHHNISDIALADHSIIRPNQFVEDPQQLAGNYFNDLATCSGDYDWELDADWNHLDVAWPYEDMTITYFRNEDDHTKAWCPTLAQHFVDQPWAFSGPFIENEDCANGVLDLHHTQVQAETAYREARALCTSAKNLLDGNTDGGERPDLIAELEQDSPWLSSGFLRDRLMLNSPLSNEVLRAMIRRAQSMDPWHITQVCLQNSRLDPAIISQLRTAGVLNEFFMNVVMQAQTGTGLTGKQVLQKEWMLRRAQQAQALAEAGWYWGTDTINPGGSNDTLLAALETDGGLDHRWSRMALRLIEGDMSGASDLFETFTKYQSGRDALEAVITIGATHNGDWSLLTGPEVEQLVSYAESGVQGAALYAGILSAYNLAEVDVEARFPNQEKSMLPTPASASGNVGEGALTAITAYPTPADDATMLTFPAALNGSGFQLEDAQGRVVYTGRLENAGVHHLETSTLPNGVYGISVSDSDVRGRF